MGEILPLPYFATPIRTRTGWGVSGHEEFTASIEAKLLAAFERAAARAAKRRVRCGAKTRKGVPCRCLSEPGKRRCKFHGGRSTGPKTTEGIERIREAQLRRWQASRASLLLAKPSGHEETTAPLRNQAVGI
ncbi:HGGxSTG domain-containing protein [Thioclava marina]|uniref:HGGxSTG domain-containing protein n=1 Tax=Thioclava marina TaxID=1915077 RepID=UPI0024820062|nr:HGGxSTG domain-containing protein [Thioclava marina]